MQFTVAVLETSTPNFSQEQLGWINGVINQLRSIQPGWGLDSRTFMYLKEILEFQHSHTYTDVINTAWQPTYKQTSYNRIY